MREIFYLIKHRIYYCMTYLDIFIDRLLQLKGSMNAFTLKLQLHKYNNYIVSRI